MVTSPPPDKTCCQCGVLQPLTQFPYCAERQTYRGTCKACRAAEHRVRRRHPANVERLREQERVRSAARRPAIRAWERAHPENLRPGRQRRWARRAARRREARGLSPAPPAQPPGPALPGPTLEAASGPQQG